jgi:hypothetical protein
MKTLLFLPAVFLLILFTGCGDPSVDINNAKYEPKIAVEGYLFCGETVKDFRLTRNFKIGAQVASENLYLTPQENKVNITINSTPLYFDASKKTYYNNNLQIDYGKEYQLEIYAEIDGKQLFASSKTTTPQKGFSVINHNLGTVKYRQSPLTIDFKTSPGTGLYIFSIIADSANLKSFIFDNPYMPNLDSSDVKKGLNQFRFQSNMISDINSFSDNTYKYQFQGWDTWFYSPYTVTVYAGDNNFRNYFLTAQETKEFDGNFHEPIQIFEGDGIGVFASAIKETVKLTITK